MLRKPTTPPAIILMTMSRICKVDSPSGNDSTDSSFRDAQGSAPLKLPRISLPKFSGNYLEWENFRNTFESLLIHNGVLTNIRKFHYLKSSVTGDAALLIANLKISDANYESAWQLLLDEYDDKQALIHAHIHSFMSFPPMKSENVSELKKLRDTLSASLAALTNLGSPVDQWDDILIYIVSQKFSPRTRNEWNLKRSIWSSDLPSWKDLHEFMTLRIRGLTDHSDLSTNSANSRNCKAKSSVNNVSVVKCLNCDGNHNLSKCEDFLSKPVAQRNAIVRQKKICFNCLRSGHFTLKCKTSARCKHCGRAHHSTLHAVNSDDQKEPVSQATATAVNANNFVVASGVAVANVQTVQTQCTPTPNVLLATAWVDLHTAEGRRFKVRALLDQGSTFSFVSESLSQIMRTKRYCAELRIRCFGEKYTGIAKSRVSLRLSPCAQQTPLFPLIHLTAYVYQRITSYAASQIQPINSWSHLRDLSLADPNPTSNHPIHLLIGADLYGSLLLGDLRQGPIGTPTAQSTALGWILSGPTAAVRPSHEDASVFNCVSDTDTNSCYKDFGRTRKSFSRCL